VISFRSHVVSLLAVFLALAVGVVLGGGPLSEVGRGATAEDLAAAQADAIQARADAKRATAYADTFALATAGRTLAHGLDGQTVVVLSMPGASDDQVAAVAGLVDTAGGTVVGHYQLLRSLFDAQQNSLVDTLGSQLGQLYQPTAPSATTYPRIGRLLGGGVSTASAAGTAFDSTAVAIRESLKGADLVREVGAPVKRGALVLVVLGDEPAADAGVDSMLAGVASGLDQVASGVVIVGSGSSGESGLLDALRGSDALSEGVSTADSIETGAGQVGAVLALIASSAGSAGSYGASGSDGAVALR
jgi:hypothetical protein